MRTLIYLVGEPGAGKTTALRTALADYARTESRAGECPVMILARPPGQAADGLPDRITELGRDREGPFGGTDALSMSVSPKAVAALDGLDGLVVAEGDRLAHDGFLRAAEENGWQVVVMALTTSPSEAAARRRARDGGAQNETWVTGRRTKAVTLARRWGAVRIDGNRTAPMVARELRAAITKSAATP